MKSFQKPSLCQFVCMRCIQKFRNCPPAARTGRRKNNIKTDLNKIRHKAMKFSEWFYCKHTNMLTAYWEMSPSKYSPWTAMHLAQRCWHCWEQFWNSCCGIDFITIVTFLWTSSVSWNLRPFKADYFWKQLEVILSHIRGIGCSISIVYFLARNWLRGSAFWAGAL